MTVPGKSQVGRYDRARRTGRRAVTVQFPADVHRRMKARADDEEIAMSALVRLAVRRYLGDIP